MTAPRPRQGGPPGKASAPSSRKVALEALVRIEGDGAYANLVLPGILAASRLDERDRGLVTELVYGTTRMRRACDELIEPYVLRPLDPPTRAALRLGVFQLVFLGVPPHAAVSETVEAAPPKVRGLINAVLRRVASRPPQWATEPARLSYPDWLVDRLQADLGEDAAVLALQTMNHPPPVTTRQDGYVQDLASQWVADALDASHAARVLDVCAAPGGKATRLAQGRAGDLPTVVALDVRPGRARLLAGNVDRLGSAVVVGCADGEALPFPDARFDRVLVDAPCSGLGALRRRPDARWRINESDIARLATLQLALIHEALRVAAPGAMVLYSVCTLSEAETLGVDRALAASHPELQVAPPLASPWQAHGRGFLLLPQAADTDGMYVLRLVRPSITGKADPAMDPAGPQRSAITQPPEVSAHE
ncbi:MAG: transcription antitermination factor NusB [Acidimicrobiales bacterium]